MAICFPLSWKLLIYALETLFVASDKTPVYLVNNQVRYDTQYGYTCESAFPASRKACVESTGTRVYP
jgi:hypothetical protein